MTKEAEKIERALRKRVDDLEKALDAIAGLNDRDPGVSRVKMRRIVERVKPR